MLLEQDLPRAHLVMDDFFDPGALAAVFEELGTLEAALKPGLVRDIGHDGQSVFFAHPRRRNRALWVHDPATTLRLFRERFWADDLVAGYLGAREPLFQIIPDCSAPNLQLSSYMTGDHYDFHEDEGGGVNLTVIVLLARDPRKVRGGDLELAYDGEVTRIPFRHNRLVVFPSKTLHRVTRVRVDSKDVQFARISLQSWLVAGRTQLPDRPAEADRPTFLAAEPAIVRAAQALLSVDPQSPEDLYWGAFYTSRILAQNLRALAVARGLDVGPVRIRRTEGLLEIFARVRGEKRRLGFALGDALRLFVTHGKVRRSRPIPPDADEARALAVLDRLLRKT